jgi:transcriptional regulator with XRE-family HTH domain
MTTLISADAFRVARALAGLSQREAAKHAETTQKAIWQAEGSEHTSIPANGRLRAFYEKLGIEFLGSVDLASGYTSGLGARWRTPPQLPVLPTAASNFRTERTGVAFGAARALLNHKQSEIAELSHIHVRKISLLESGASVDQPTALRLRSYYEQQSITFLGWGDVTSGLFYGVGVRWQEGT